MPVIGFPRIPDASRHRLCLRCRRWFEPHEGREAHRSSVLPFVAFIRAARAASGFGTRYFICDDCRRFRRNLTIAGWAILGGGLAAIFVLEKLGLI